MEMTTAAAKNRLKLAVLLEKKISVGGGFNQSITAALQMLRIAPEQYAVEIYTTVESNIAVLAKQGLQARHFVKPKRPLSKKIGQVFQSARRTREEVTEFEQEIRRLGIDLVYFTAPSGYALDLQTVPYIFTIWDLCHLEHPEFPEVTANREFEKREELYSRAVVKALTTLTDGLHTTGLASQRYGVAAERFIEMPFSPAPHLQTRLSSSADAGAALQRHGIAPGYLFYPAQFWAHKNHARILEACALLAARDGTAPHVVFAGGDQGHASDVRKLAERLGVAATTHFLGFVPEGDMAALYEGAGALVMPSYFGPSNLPPMEAWVAGKPVLYPDRFAGFVGDAAILFDPDNAQSLVEAIDTVTRGAGDGRWETLGRQRLEHFAQERARSEGRVTALLSRLAARKALLR